MAPAANKRLRRRSYGRFEQFETDRRSLVLEIEEEKKPLLCLAATQREHCIFSLKKCLLKMMLTVSASHPKDASNYFIKMSLILMFQMRVGKAVAKESTALSMPPDYSSAAKGYDAKENSKESETVLMTPRQRI